MLRRQTGSNGKRRVTIDSEATFDAKTNRMVQYYHASVFLTIVLVFTATCITLYGIYDREAANPVLTMADEIAKSADQIADQSEFILNPSVGSELSSAKRDLQAAEKRILDETSTLREYVTKTWAVNRHSSILNSLPTLDDSVDAVLRSSNKLNSVAMEDVAFSELRAIANQVSKDSERVAESASALSNATAKARDHAIRMRSFGVLALTGLMILVAIVQPFFIFKSIKRSFERRGRDLVNHKEQTEAQLQELLARSEILRERQTEYEEKIAEQQINADHVRRALDRMRELVTSLPIASIGTDVEGTVYEWNSAAEKTFGYPAYEVLHHSLGGLVINPEDRDRFSEKLGEAVSEDRSINFQLPGLRKDAQLTTLEWSLMPMRGANGEVSGITITAHDVSESVRQKERLTELAFKDALTGLHNRRSFFAELDALYPTISADAPVSVILLDVDKFKVYNDTYGHSAGDAVLQRVGEIMRNVVVSPMSPGRYGGEEFVILLPETPEAEAFTFAERVRRQIAAKTEDLHFVTASLGVATSRDPNFSSKELIDRADRALYVSKREGRNRSTLWDPSMDEKQAA